MVGFGCCHNSFVNRLIMQVPSRWDAFIEQLHASSVDDCIMFYESEMNSILRKYNQGTLIAIRAVDNLIV